MLNDTVLVRPDKEYDAVDENPEVARIIKEGLIKIPEQYEGAFKKSAMRGEVITWGPKCSLKFKEGEFIYYVRYGGAKVNWNDDKYLILREHECLALEEND